MSDQRAARRHRWRIACEVVAEGRSQRAIMLDLSETGVSVARGGVGLKILDAPRAVSRRYRVRVKQKDGPRSRSVEILADSPDDALAVAPSQVGEGWEAVSADLLG